MLAAALGGVAARAAWLRCSWCAAGRPASPPPALPDRALVAEVLAAVHHRLRWCWTATAHVLPTTRAPRSWASCGPAWSTRSPWPPRRAAVAGEPIDVEFGRRRSRTDRARAATRLGAGGGPVHRRRAVLVAATDESAAQRLEAVRRDFVANVSHELKTPVAAMGLLAEATVDAADEPEHGAAFAGSCCAESVRLGALVNELITLSRLQGATRCPTWPSSRSTR